MKHNVNGFSITAIGKWEQKRFSSDGQSLSCGFRLGGTLFLKPLCYLKKTVATAKKVLPNFRQDFLTIKISIFIQIIAKNFHLNDIQKYHLIMNLNSSHQSNDFSIASIFPINQQVQCADYLIADARPKGSFSLCYRKPECPWSLVIHTPIYHR